MTSRCCPPLSTTHVRRFVMGSNKLLQVALGKTEADEYRTNLHLLSERLRGQVVHLPAPFIYLHPFSFNVIHHDDLFSYLVD